MSEYRELRTASLNMVGSSKDHPCQRGNAQCCSTNAPVIPQDEQLIRGDIATGKISPDVMRKVFKNLDDPNWKSCPFLSDEKACMIYDSRPLSCVFWGVAGYPNTKSEEMMNAANRVSHGPDEMVSRDAILPYACNSCETRLDLMPPKKMFSVRAIATSVQVARFVQSFNGPRLSITKVLAEKLSKSVKLPPQKN